ncbi:unnamed protein product [Paramecium sonneborni]|uniref:Uncharacterized protein n=1 Tax=Paramecium sonneborni TaxID=65129 RepID=A0A8S1RI80_9CILI|nr:unnamed protein product [Paramecium sonneborni]
MVFKYIQIFISQEQDQRIKCYLMERRGTQSELIMIMLITDKVLKQDGILIKLERKTQKLQAKLAKTREIMLVDIKEMLIKLNKNKMTII